MRAPHDARGASLLAAPLRAPGRLRAVVRDCLAVVREEVRLPVPAPEHAAAHGRDRVGAVVRVVVLEDAAVAAEDRPARPVDAAVRHADVVAREVEEERALRVLVAVEDAVHDLAAQAVAHDDAVPAHRIARQEVPEVVFVAPLVRDELQAQAPERDIVRQRAARRPHAVGGRHVVLRDDAVAVLSRGDEEVVDAEGMRTLDQVLRRLERVRPEDLRERAVLALQEHVRRNDERAREHVASAGHVDRAAAVPRRRCERGVEGVRIALQVVRLGAVVLDVEHVGLPHGARRRDGPRARVVPVRPALQAVAHLDGVGPRRHVRRHARREAPDVRLLKRERAAAQEDADARLRRRRAGGREGTAEDAQHTARRRRIAAIALQPPHGGRVERERTGDALSVPNAPLDDRLAVSGEREDEPRVGEHGRRRLPPRHLHARIGTPVAAVEEDVFAPARRVRGPSDDGG